MNESTKRHTIQEVTDLVNYINQRMYNYTSTPIAVQVLKNNFKKGEYAIQVLVGNKALPLSGGATAYCGSIDAIYHYLNGIVVGQMIAGEDLSSLI
jgi:hypothetical protein